MQKVTTMKTIQQMTDEEVATLNKKMNRRAIRNVVIFVGVKVAIAYGLHRWAKSMANAN